MLTFRTAEHSDIPILRSLAQIIWRAYYPSIIGSEQVEYMLEMMYSETVIRQEMDDEVLWELACEAEDPVGFLSLSAEAETEERAKLHKLYLLPNLHGSGAGQQLIARACQAAASIGACEVWLQVNKRNVRAIQAYLRAGFHIAKESVFDIGNGFVMDDFIMSRAVP